MEPPSNEIPSKEPLSEDAPSGELPSEEVSSKEAPSKKASGKRASGEKASGKKASSKKASSKKSCRAKPQKFYLQPPTDRKHHQWCGWYIDVEWARGYGRLQELDPDAYDVGSLAVAAVEQLMEYSGFKNLSIEFAWPPVDEPDSAAFTIMACCGTKAGQRQRPTQEQLDKLMYMMGGPPKWYLQVDWWPSAFL